MTPEQMCMAGVASLVGALGIMAKVIRHLYKRLEEVQREHMADIKGFVNTGQKVVEFSRKGRQIS